MTLVNQRSSLCRTYDYFRERALDPVVVKDKRTVLGPHRGALAVQ